MMETKTVMRGLRKILKICYRNGFFQLKTSENFAKGLHFGPLGSLFRRNIWREWLSSSVNNADLCMFPIEVPQSRIDLKNELPHSEKSYSLLQNILKNCVQTPSLSGLETPYGFALYGFTQSSLQSSKLICDSPVIRQIESKNYLTNIFLCPVKKSSDWFYYWAQYRHRWWRKFSSIPSKFSMSNVTETPNGEQQISLMMEFPWGKEVLETVTLYSENILMDKCQELQLDKRKISDTSSAVIACESELNLAAFAYLCNSFSEKWRNERISKLFHLHVKLAPYKVSLAMNGDSLEDLKNLRDVAKHLEKELKKSRVAVFPYFSPSIENNAPQIRQYDEMGIPYTIVLNKKALQSGIAALRNRDTTLEEQIHIAELTPKLLKYLQMKSNEMDEL